MGLRRVVGVMTGMGYCLGIREHTQDQEAPRHADCDAFEDALREHRGEY